MRRPWGPATAPPVPPVRLTVELTDDPALRTPDRPMGPAVVLSPAGDRFVFVTAGTAPAIYARQLDGLTASPIAGTESGYGPFFSPDGEWIAFFANGRLKKAALSGGGATILADAADPRGGAWLDDGTIVFAPRVETPSSGYPPREARRSRPLVSAPQRRNTRIAGPTGCRAAAACSTR